MRMTTKLLSLLTILFVFFKFGESAKAMLSISGDKNFLLHSANLAIDEVVGFVYDDTAGGVVVLNCTAENATSFALKSDCTIRSLKAVDVTTSIIREAATSFATAKITANMMVTQPATTPAVAKIKSQLSAADALLVAVSVITTATQVATQANSMFLCNGLTEAASKAFFAVNVDSTGVFGQIFHESTAAGTQPAILKCAADITNADSSTGQAYGTYVLLVVDHDDITNRFYLLALPSTVILHRAITNATAAKTQVGYIDGKEACPTNVNLTFATTTASTTPCKGSITLTNAANNTSIIYMTYDTERYYLPVAGNDNAATCPATTTCTESGFAFNFKYSKISIGMLLIYLLKMLNSH